jgi:hypothetical protein
MRLTTSGAGPKKWVSVGLVCLLFRPVAFLTFAANDESWARNQLQYTSGTGTGTQSHSEKQCARSSRISAARWRGPS